MMDDMLGLRVKVKGSTASGVGTVTKIGDGHCVLVQWDAWQQQLGGMSWHAAANLEAAS